MISTDLSTDFAGQRGPLFALVLRTSLLTVMTLGIYRFWAKTFLRRYYWSSVRPGGTPLEYVGEPIEKLLGFLIAVVVMAFYLGIVNLILMFASFALFQSNAAAYALSFLGVVPIWFYAMYRARRYVLARTRWRGVRFALEPGAWGYAFRALYHWTLTILTAGLLWPRMTFFLEKYKTDRTWYGDQKLTQNGRWTMLFKAAFPAILCAAAFVVSTAALIAGAFIIDASSSVVLGNTGLWGTILGVSLVALPFTLVHYRVKALELLTNHKTAGEIGLRLVPSTGRVIRIVFLGNLLASFLVSLCLFVLGLVIAFGARGENVENLIAGGALPAWVATLIALISYFFVFVVWGGLRHIYVTQPLWRHYAEVLTVTGAPHIAHINQRDRDHHQEAEGFAEALDLGAAI